MDETASFAKPSLRVLVVEDHADSANAIARLLRMIGHTATVARDVRGAVSLVDTERFDLLLCDITLPDGSGLDLMRHVSRVTPIKAIALTGHVLAAEDQEFKRAGFLAHLSKPVDFAMLQRTIDTVSKAG